MQCVCTSEVQFARIYAYTRHVLGTARIVTGKSRGRGQCKCPKSGHDPAQDRAQRTGYYIQCPVCLACAGCIDGLPVGWTLCHHEEVSTFSWCEFEDSSSHACTPGPQDQCTYICRIRLVVRRGRGGNRDRMMSLLAVGSMQCMFQLVSQVSASLCSRISYLMHMMQLPAFYKRTTASVNSGIYQHVVVRCCRLHCEDTEMMTVSGLQFRITFELMSLFPVPVVKHVSDTHRTRCRRVSPLQCKYELSHPHARQ